MVIDDDGIMWMGTDGGLVRYTRKGAEHGQVSELFTVAEGLPHNSIRALYLDDDGTLWLASKGGGLSTFNRASGAIRQVGQLPTDKILSMVGGSSRVRSGWSSLRRL